MTPDQRKRVAEMIYPSNKWVITNGIVHPWYPMPVKFPPGQFNPEFFGSAEQRSQALAAAVKAAQLISQKYESYMVRSEHSNHLRRLLEDEDAEGLCKFVLELCESNDSERR